MMAPKKWDFGTAGSAAIFGRDVELQVLRERLRKRESFLLHGPAGAGKTLLLSTLSRELPFVVYSSQNSNPQEVYRNVGLALLAAGDTAVAAIFPGGAAQLQMKSATAMRGIVRDVLTDSSYVLVLDHLSRPSQALAAVVRELKVNGSVPVIAVA